MKRMNLILAILSPLAFACSKHQEAVRVPDYTKDIVGKYQMVSAQSLKLNEQRTWIFTRVGDNKLDAEEIVTSNVNNDNPRVVKFIFKNVAVKNLGSTSNLILDFEEATLENSDYQVNGHKNFKVSGCIGVISNDLIARLSFEDLDNGEFVPHGEDPLFFEKIL